MTALAFLPLFILLFFLLVFRWSSQRAGLVAWGFALIISILAYGLTPGVFWVSQAKGLLLAFYVLAIFWPALFLYFLILGMGGIKTLTQLLEFLIGDRSFLVLILAWAFSGFLEGLAGFGIPIVVVAPILVSLGIEPVLAVAAVAVGHAWSVTFGDMGVIFQTLIATVHVNPVDIIPITAFLLGVTCLFCGLGTAFLLKQLRKWPVVFIISVIMSIVQFGLAAAGFAQLAAFGAGFAGVIAGILYGYFSNHRIIRGEATTINHRQEIQRNFLSGFQFRKGITSVLLGYGGLVIFMLVVALPSPISRFLYPILWQAKFPSVSTSIGFLTPASLGPAYRIFLHPGTAILLASLICAVIFSQKNMGGSALWYTSFRSALRVGFPASLGIIITLEISTLMEHTGMTLKLAQGLGTVVGPAFPLISPWIGILGAFASGSNNNSNVLFGMLQKNTALMLGLQPAPLIAAQTTGGALGSMIAPAKIVVGCSTAGIPGKEGEVLRRTLSIGLGTGFLIGVIVLGILRLAH